MKGFLIVNVGSPKTPTTKDVKTYLDQFLMDPYVIDLPYLLRAFLVKGIILNIRPKRSAQAYRTIWWDEGSPLIVLTKRLLDKLRQELSSPVAMGMAYGAPSMNMSIKQLVDQGVTDLKVVPLFPQYAMATTRSVVENAKKITNKHFPEIKLSFVTPFYQHSGYLDPLCNSVFESLKDKPIDHVLFSYHGLPERHIKKTDPTKSHCQIDENCCQASNKKAQAFCYRHQCFETTESVAKRLGFESNFYSISFQSRLGRDKWLEPSTKDTLVRLAKQYKRIAIVAPSFVTDCLETLEELGHEAQEIFKEAGGEEIILVPCLNDREDWVKGLAQICQL